jgi:hypothetical protein
MDLFNQISNFTTEIKGQEEEPEKNENGSLYRDRG